MQSQANERAEDPTILLSLLSAIERSSSLTQRSLSSELGIALGLTNAYLRRCVKKGLIKVRQAPLNRYAYYLTPQGFADKSRLTAEYLTVSLNFFRRARLDCARALEDCAAHSWRRAVLFGTGDLAEIAIISAHDAGVEILSVVDPEASSKSCAGLAVVASLRKAARLADGAIHAVIVTGTKAPQATFDLAVAAAQMEGIAAERVLAPALLHITRPKSSGGSGETGARP